MIQTNQKGYILTECLIGLMILCTVAMSLSHVLPKLLKKQQHLDVQQTLYYHLYVLKDLWLFEPNTLSFPLHLTSPIPYTVTQKDAQLCATYDWRESGEQKICL